MKVLDASLGRLLKYEAACCAAAKALVVLMFKLLAKSDIDSDSGDCLSLGVAAAALEKSQQQMVILERQIHLPL